MSVPPAFAAAPPASTDEWPLKPGVDTQGESVGPRLSALLGQRPRFPPLPPEDAFLPKESQPAQPHTTTEQKQTRAHGQADTVSSSSHPRRVRFGPADDNSMYDEEEEAGEEEDLGSSESEILATRATFPPSADASPDDLTALPSATAERRALQQRTLAQQARAEEELLYDPLADDEDERWMRARERREVLPKKKKGRRKGVAEGGTGDAMAEPPAAAALAASALSPLPPTDAHLSCPACFTPLCFSCQRHSTRSHLYRAMFVTENVLVDKGRQVRPEPGTAEEGDEQLKFYVALCRTCKTHVGVMDSEEVFHFHNVLDAAT